MARPYWSGQFQLSLVSFGIQLFPATEASSEIHFHQLNRKTGERIKHRNVSAEDDPLEKDEIVKGYEYSKGEYVMIEPEDIENLRIPSRQTLSVVQFVSRDELDLRLFEKPYFVAPENASQLDAFAVVRKAMQSTGKAALGKIAFGGREHLIAMMAPESDEELGMMAYTMRYAEELRDASEYFQNIKRVAIDDDQLTLAKELIQRKTSPFDPTRYKDEYEASLRAMVEAKIEHAPLPKAVPASKSNKVINLMDALRKSVQAGSKDEAPRTTQSGAGKAMRGQKLSFPAQAASVAPRGRKDKTAKTASKRRSA
jgi:DNA end-binding protein Ku